MTKAPHTGGTMLITIADIAQALAAGGGIAIVLCIISSIAKSDDASN